MTALWLLLIACNDGMDDTDMDTDTDTDTDMDSVHWTPTIHRHSKEQTYAGTGFKPDIRGD